MLSTSKLPLPVNVTQNSVASWWPVLSVDFIQKNALSYLTSNKTHLLLWFSLIVADHKQAQYKQWQICLWEGDMRSSQQAGRKIAITHGCLIADHTEPQTWRRQKKVRSTRFWMERVCPSPAFKLTCITVWLNYCDTPEPARWSVGIGIGNDMSSSANEKTQRDWQGRTGQSEPQGELFTQIK